MLKKILSYGFVEGIAKGLNKLILLLLPFFLNTTDFGKVGLILSIETLLPFITLLGFERAILRFYSEHDTFQSFDKTLANSINISHLLVLIGLGGLYLLNIKEVLGLKIFPDLVILLILVYLQGINQIVLNKFRVKENHRKYFKSRLFLQIGKFVLVLALVYYTKSYLGYLIGGIIVALITNLLFNVKSTKKSPQKFSSKTFNYLFLFSWPFIFHGMAVNLLGNADKFILERYLTLSDVGQYTFVYSLGSMMAFGFIGISVYLEPIIYKSDIKQREKLINDYILYGSVISVILFSIISIFSQYFLGFIYKKDYANVAYLIPLIAISFIVYPYYLTANYRMIYEKKTRQIAVLSILTCIFNIVLNFILIPKYHLFASVLVTYISYFIQALIFTYISYEKKMTRQMLEILILGILFFSFIIFKINYFIMILVFLFYIGYLFYIKKIQYD
ncbi:oligosaccharide flippase family protein [Chryseobacterium sp. CT-SW4]|uniref:oligosaccharide flippase family protein n=1 Tax=Chryseobacterium sp. SW-1 TaxID=3157343 RepID=UPI003B02DFB1